jgi:hypothetical protein
MNSLLALCHVPKTGGTTLVSILRRSFGIRHCDVEPIGGRRHTYGVADHRFTTRLTPRLTSIAGHQVTPASDLGNAVPGILYVALLRDPWTQAAAGYQHVEIRYAPPPLEEALQRPWWRNRQTRQIAGVADVEVAKRTLEEKDLLIGLTESFDEFLVMLRRRFPDPDLDIRYRKQNVAPRNDLARSLLEDPHARARIEEANRVDLAFYRWVREDFYPRQRARFPDLDADVERFRALNRPPSFSAQEVLNRTWRNLVYKPALRLARLLP